MAGPRKRSTKATDVERKVQDIAMSGGEGYVIAHHDRCTSLVTGKKKDCDCIPALIGPFPGPASS